MAEEVESFGTAIHLAHSGACADPAGLKKFISLYPEPLVTYILAAMPCRPLICMLPLQMLLATSALAETHVAASRWHLHITGTETGRMRAAVEKVAKEVDRKTYIVAEDCQSIAIEGTASACGKFPVFKHTFLTSSPKMPCEASMGRVDVNLPDDDEQSITLRLQRCENGRWRQLANAGRFELPNDQDLQEGRRILSDEELVTRLRKLIVSLTFK